MHRSRRVIVAVAALSVLSLSACDSHHSGTDTVAADGGAQAMDPNMPGMDHSKMDMPKAVGDGLSSTAGGYTLTKLTAPKKAGESGTLSFTIQNADGKPHTAFAQTQTKLMHFYVVRKDLTQYQHIHPTLDTTTGEWSMKLAVTEPGPYRVLAEFEALAPNGEFDDRKIGGNFTVPGKYTPQKFTPTYSKATVGGYELALDGQPKVGGEPLTLTITKGGADVTDLQPYLASFAHVTGFREGDLKAVHVHPNETPSGPNAGGGPALTLATRFAEAGKYRLFVEFQVGDKLQQAPLDIEVA